MPKWLYRRIPGWYFPRTWRKTEVGNIAWKSNYCEGNRHSSDHKAVNNQWSKNLRKVSICHLFEIRNDDRFCSCETSSVNNNNKAKRKRTAKRNNRDLTAVVTDLVTVAKKRRWQINSQVLVAWELNARATTQPNFTCDKECFCRKKVVTCFRDFKDNQTQNC